MKKIMIGLMMVVLMPWVMAFSMSDNYPTGIIDIVGNDTEVVFGVMIDYDIILPDLNSINNPWCGTTDAIAHEGGIDYNITLDGCINNESQALGNITYIIPSGERCFFAWCSYHNETKISVEMLYDDGMCYVWNARSEEDGVFEFLFPEESVYLAECSLPEEGEDISENVDLGTILAYNTSTESISSFDVVVMVNNNSTEYDYDNDLVNGSVLAVDGGIYEVMVSVNTLDGIKNLTWSFATRIPEPVLPPVIVYVEDDDEPRSRGGGGGGGYVPIILKDSVTKNITVNGSLPKDSIDKPLPTRTVNATPEVNNMPVVVSGSEFIDEDKKSYAWIYWVLIGFLICGIIGAGLYYMRKEE